MFRCFSLTTPSLRLPCRPGHTKVAWSRWDAVVPPACSLLEWAFARMVPYRRTGRRIPYGIWKTSALAKSCFLAFLATYPVPGPSPCLAPGIVPLPTMSATAVARSWFWPRVKPCCSASACPAGTTLPLTALLLARSATTASTVAHVVRSSTVLNHTNGARMAMVANFSPTVHCGETTGHCGRVPYQGRYLWRD
jgi:hypothetical protein